MLSSLVPVLALVLFRIALLFVYLRTLCSSIPSSVIPLNPSPIVLPLPPDPDPPTLTPAIVPFLVSCISYSAHSRSSRDSHIHKCPRVDWLVSMDRMPSLFFLSFTLHTCGFLPFRSRFLYRQLGFTSRSPLTLPCMPLHVPWFIVIFFRTLHSSSLHICLALDLLVSYTIRMSAQPQC